nr:PAS domain S-box protein [Methanosarcina sp. KYL-1]
MALVGTDGKWLKVNSTLCGILGYSEAELLQLDFQSLTHPDDLGPNSNLFNEILKESAGVYQTEKRYIKKDGVPIWTRVSTFLSRDYENRPLFFVSLIEDIDAQKKSVLALKESRERLKTIFENASECITINEPDGCFLEVNKMMCEVMGYSRDELLKMKPYEIVAPEFATHLTPDFAELLERKHATFELTVTRKDGMPIPTELKVQLIDYGEKKAVLTIAQDMSERKQAEEALHNQIRFLETLLNTIPAPVFYKDMEGRYQGCNELFASKIAALPKEQLIGRTVGELPKSFTKKTVCLHRKKDLELLRNGGLQLYESKVVCGTGEPRDFLFSKAAYGDASGKVVGITGVMLDITERKKAEEDLLNQVQFLKNLLNAVPAPVFYKDVKGRYQGCNERFGREILGLPEELIIGRTVHELSELIPKKMASLYGKKDLELLETGGAQLYEGKALCADRKVRDFLFSKTTYGNASGEVIGIIGVMLDITKRKQMEKNLKVTNTAVESSINAMAFTNLKGRLTYVNPSFLKLWGYEDAKELLRNSSKCLWENQRKASVAFWRLHSEGKWEGDLVGKRKDNTLFDVHISANLLYDEKGRKIGMMGSFLDVTQQRKAEAALIEAKLNADAANRAKSEFLATMSHELRTPLNAVIGFSDILLSQNFGRLNEKQLRYSNNILKSGKHLLKLINDILDLSKVEAGVTELHLEEFSLSDAVNEVRTMLMPRSSQKNIRIMTQIGPGKTKVVADKTRFNQILYNLVGNALKFTPEGSMIIISVQMTEDKFQISVADQGKGIPQAEQQRIFQPFVQLEKFESREQAGAGLGLALVKRFVEMHGGDIWVESEAGKGSTFKFTIPVEDEKTNKGQTVCKSSIFLP